MSQINVLLRSFVAGFICSYRTRLIAIGSIEEIAATVNLKLLRADYV